MDRKFTKDEHEFVLVDLIGDDFLCSEIAFLLQLNGFSDSKLSGRLPRWRESVRQNFITALVSLYIFLKRIPFLEAPLNQLKNSTKVLGFFGFGEITNHRSIMVFPENFPQSNAFVILPNYFAKEALSRAQSNNLSCIFVPSCNLFIQFKRGRGSRSSEIIESKYPLPVSIVRNSLGQRNHLANGFHGGIILIVSDSKIFDIGTIYNEELLRVCKRFQFDSVTFLSEADQEGLEINIGLSSISKTFSTRTLNSHNFEFLLSLIRNASAVCNLTETNFNFFKRLSNLSQVRYFSFSEFEATEDTCFLPYTILGKLRLFSERLSDPLSFVGFPEELNAEDSFRLLASNAINEIQENSLR